MHSEFAWNSPGNRLQANSVTFENLNVCDLFCRFMVVAGVPAKFQWSFRNRQSQECQEIHLWTWNYELSVQSWARSSGGWTGRGGRSGQSHAANLKFVIPTKSLYITFEWLSSTLVSGKACPAKIWQRFGIILGDFFALLWAAQIKIEIGTC